ncbi:hypothetical protein AU14_18295 [Marinobacter similis]|uniref:Uncharacterized protein n=1 Tax=Marinobacter similis TaxID=1420916 RepID=W5YMH1_9GAMM|nr:hypothetical protein AU14_18295 [Marinobacter similis]
MIRNLQILFVAISFLVYQHWRTAPKKPKEGSTKRVRLGTRLKAVRPAKFI